LPRRCRAYSGEADHQIRSKVIIGSGIVFTCWPGGCGLDRWGDGTSWV
jgi:hypothetical protein